MKSQRLIGISIFLVCSIMLLSCAGDDGISFPNPLPADYQYQPPAETGDGWSTASLTDMGIDPAPYESLIDHINSSDQGYRFIDSVLVAKDGQLVFHEQLRTKLDLADEWAQNRDINLHALNSVTKSFLSALIGIAIDQGLIAGVEAPVHDYFTHKQPIQHWSDSKASITLEDWLTMRHGYEWDEWNLSYLDPANVNSQLNASKDPIQFLLDRPMAEPPGEVFAYSTGVSFGLGRLLEHASGQQVIEFMKIYLFDPMGIEKYDLWRLDGQLHTGSALYLSNRDMAKIGQLYLDGGVWQGQRLISEDWITASTQRHVASSEGVYGYHWWVSSFHIGGQILETFYASGYGGQLIYVFPAINAVVCFTGSSYLDGEAEQKDIRKILEQHILPPLLS